MIFKSLADNFYPIFFFLLLKKSKFLIVDLSFKYIIITINILRLIAY